MRKLSVFAASLFSVLTVSTALADPLPVVAVNREIGLSMAGLFDNRVSGGTSTYTAAPTSYSRGYRSTSHGVSRRIGWVPGVQVDASTMFNLGGIENLYASAQFVLGSGSRNYKNRYTTLNSIYGSREFNDGGGSSSHSIYTRGEIGKGFLLLDNTLLLTPFAQGGYLTQGEYSYGDDGSTTFVGAGFKADYALTDRLVLRGRFGWAALLERQFIFENGVRSRWEGGLGLDYRMTRHIHLIGGGDYAYTDYGHGTDRWSYNGNASIDSASAFQNGLNLHAGLAYRY